MLVNQKDLREFMRLYKDEFGNDITEGEAEEIISRLITLYTKYYVQSAKCNGVPSRNDCGDSFVLMVHVP